MFNILFHSFFFVHAGKALFENLLMWPRLPSKTKRLSLARVKWNVIWNIIPSSAKRRARVLIPSGEFTDSIYAISNILIGCGKKFVFQCERQQFNHTIDFIPEVSLLQICVRKFLRVWPPANASQICTLFVFFLPHPGVCTNFLMRYIHWPILDGLSARPI